MPNHERDMTLIERLLLPADRAFGRLLAKRGHRPRTADEIRAAEEAGIATLDRAVERVVGALTRRRLPPPGSQPRV